MSATAAGMPTTTAIRSPAGFWKRYVAYFIDWLIVSSASGMVTQVLLGAFYGREIARLQSFVTEAQNAAQGNEGTGPDPAALLALVTPLAWKLVLWSTIAYAVFGCAYFALFEASAAQATPGKRLAGIQVVGPDGGRIGLPRAIARFLAAALSWLTLNLGHAMAAIAPEHRALHDRIAGTRVENADPSNTAMPAWGWIIIALTAGLFVLTVLGGVLAVLALIAQASQA